MAVTGALSTLRSAIDTLSGAQPDLRFSWGAADDSYEPLGDLSRSGTDTLAFWLSQTAQLGTGLDSKTTCAYFLSIFTWQLGQVLGTIYLSGSHLPPLAAFEVSAFLPVDARRGHVLDFSFRFEPKSAGEAFDRDAMAASIVALHTPVLAGLHMRTRLAHRAMWRLVTDGVAAGFLAAGKRAGSAEKAMHEAEAILRRPDTPLHNSRWRFAEVEAAGRREAFRLRGGCCRMYRNPGDDFCTTCVLRSESDQLTRLSALLAKRAAG